MLKYFIMKNENREHVFKNKQRIHVREVYFYTLLVSLQVSNVQGLVSQAVISRTLRNTTCVRNADCVYGTVCQTGCDVTSATCKAIPDNYIPDIVKICYVVQEYVLFGLPPKLKVILSHLVGDCIRMGRRSQSTDLSRTAVLEMLTLDRLNQALWDEIKYSYTKWVEKTTPKTPPIL